LKFNITLIENIILNSGNLTRDSKIQKFIIIAIYVATFLLSSCEEAIYLYNNREVDYVADGPDICFNHDIISKDENITKITNTFNNYNEVLISKINNHNYSLNSSLKITKEIALPLEIPVPNTLLRSIAVLQSCGNVAIFKEQQDIFRPPELIESSLI
jgi:hypothetical protein